MHKIKMNADYRIGSFNGEFILIKGEFERVVLLNQSSRDLINLLIEKGSIEEAKKEWIKKKQGLSTEKRIETDFDEGVNRLVENNIFIDVACE